ncbi:hypothetical protein MCUN1_001425 [Malassezia cuniculi]|uniref:Sds3-like protein n=1 Tax=Malassezia cuniculi TaxID=948313 RepID=A0AAF0ET10_9BASI|nr:hypothetical protein MCUN1_001425 [Malassezia cuniculi]
MDSAAREQSESKLHPSSDAETEPLAFDDSMSNDDMQTEQPEDTAAPASTHPAPDSASDRPRSDLLGDSELSDYDGEDQKAPPTTYPPRPQYIDDGSSLSDADERHADPSALDALDGLAALAASVEHPAEEDPSSALSSVGDRIADADDEPADDEYADSDAATDTQIPTEPDAEFTPRKGMSTMQRAIIAAAGKRRAAATGGAPSLLQEYVDSSAPQSAATSRQASPAPESEAQAGAEDGDMPKEEAEDGAEADTGVPKGEREEEAEADGDGDADADAEADADADAEAEADADADADADGDGDGDGDGEAAAGDDSETVQWRQEAIDLLTRAEIGFAMLRDRLYIERMEELEAESAMLNEGTHPELQYLHTLIDTRKERRLALLESWQKRENTGHALRAQDDDDIAWLNWRDRAAGTRRHMIEDTYRKRRKLDQEKRLLEAPRLARRYQPFEADLLRKPVPWSAERGDDMRDYIAYPDVRGLEEYDTWMDMEQMGLPVPQGYAGYYRPEEVPPPEVYPPYYGGGAPYMVPYGAPGAPGYDVPVSVPYKAPVYVDGYGRMPMVEREYGPPVYEERQYAYADISAPPAPRTVA